MIAVGAQLSGGITFTTDAEWVGDTGTCEGDSGSPALDDLGAGMGMLSRGGAMTCDQPTYTSYAAWADWIRGNATTAAAAAGIDPPGWVTPIAPGTPQFGDDCRSDAQCTAGLTCLIIGSRRRCTDESCACSDGWVCGLAEGFSACTPDPNALPADAGPPDSGLTVTGSDSSASSGDADAGGSTRGGHHGCATAPTRGSAKGVRSATAALLGIWRRPASGAECAMRGGFAVARARREQ